MRAFDVSTNIKITNYRTSVKRSFESEQKKPRRKAGVLRLKPEAWSLLNRLLRQHVRRLLLVARRGLLRRLDRALLLERRVDRRLVGAAVLEQNLTLRRVLLAQAGARTRRADDRARRVVDGPRRVPVRPIVALVDVPVRTVMMVLTVVMVMVVTMMAAVVAAVMATVMAAMTAPVALGARQRRVQQSEPERRGRGNGQKS